MHRLPTVIISLSLSKTICKLHVCHITFINYIQAAPKSSKPCPGRICMKLQSASKNCSWQEIHLLALVAWINSLPLQVIRRLKGLLQPPARPRLKELLSSCSMFSTTPAGFQGNIPVTGTPKRLGGVSLTCFLKLGNGEGTLHYVQEQFTYPWETAAFTYLHLACPEGFFCVPPTSDSTPVTNSSSPLCTEWFLPALKSGV